MSQGDFCRNSYDVFWLLNYLYNAIITFDKVHNIVFRNDEKKTHNLSNESELNKIKNIQLLELFKL